jgi:hypothetical protein
MDGVPGPVLDFESFGLTARNISTGIVRRAVRQRGEDSLLLTHTGTRHRKQASE